ncbi:sodium/calcium exchanger [Hyphomonas neptunium ATCC 15444]|uniref:Sodium/calcium exchanger n=2 Tax=Hyphomonas TaxID=85 RepID=Q0C4Z0_HYPNA|nr:MULTISPECIES: calcium/sodium antiporter [Hyphomonas]ABI78481.1 sodium/calcium exchanger [Hyphomonas neptunium ATCC 15444]KCZ95636.1 sodium/calcium exchanger [Hyphomonas hirschiana VP5]
MPDPILLISLFGGLLLMALAGDLLVRGALGLGRAMGVSPLVAGIFIVGFGTSAPEMFISANAALNGNPGLAIGNIVGSNIANLLMVAAIPALFFPYRTGGAGQGRALFMLLLATAIWIGMTAIMPLDPIMGICFLLVLVGYAGFSIFAARHDEIAGKGAHQADAVMLNPPVWRAIFYVPLGIAGLLYASRMIITGGEGVARELGVPDEWIGLTILALGTSLPEIGAGLAAAFRQRGDVVAGNILGSNVFNILGAGGIVALFGPFEVAPLFLQYDHWVMGITAVLFAGLVMLRVRMGRLLGVLLLLIYAAYIYGLVTGTNLMALAQMAGL